MEKIFFKKVFKQDAKESKESVFESSNKNHGLRNNDCYEYRDVAIDRRGEADQRHVYPEKTR